MGKSYAQSKERDRTMKPKEFGMSCSFVGTFGLNSHHCRSHISHFASILNRSSDAVVISAVKIGLSLRAALIILSTLWISFGLTEYVSADMDTPFSTGAPFDTLATISAVEHIHPNAGPAIVPTTSGYFDSVLNIVVTVGYLLGIVGLGCWAGTRRQSGSNSKDYFLAGRTLPWYVIGLALFSTNISTIHLVALAEEGYRTGLVYGNYEWMAGFALLVLALVFAPFYIQSDVATLPDFLERRYSRASRNWLSGLAIFTAIFLHIGFSLYAGAVVLRGMFGIDTMFSIVGIAVLTGLYTIVGGLLAVVITESIQSLILIGGSICITVISYNRVGGWSGLAETVDPVKLTVFRSAGDESGLPWYAFILGYPFIGIWYWCTDQTIVQRVLGAKDENHARVGALFAGFLKLLPMFIFVLPGLICFALIKQGKLPNELTNASDTYSFMVMHLLPVGLRGLVAAVLLSALMSTISAALNSIATLFSYDIYRPLRPHVSNQHLVRVGQVVTLVGMILAILWSPLVARFDSVFKGIVAINSYVSPPIVIVFLAGVFWKKASSFGAIVTLVTGTLAGLVAFLLEFFDEYTGWPIPFMIACFYLAIICTVVMIVASKYKPDEYSEEKMKLVWDNPTDALRGPAWKGIGNFRILALLLLVVLFAIGYLFA